MVNFLSSFLPKLRVLLILIYEILKKKNVFKWTNECQQAFDNIKDLCIWPQVLHMPNPTGKFMIESDTSRDVVGGTLYQIQNDSWVLIGYHSKRFTDPVQNYGVAELELIGLYVNTHCFEILVDCRTIKYMKKAKHEPTTKRITVLLLKLQDFHCDLKYMQGPKMYVSDALSRLYSEESHEITDIIPLNFLQHIDEEQIYESYSYCTSSFYCYNVVNTNKSTVKKRGDHQKVLLKNKMRMQKQICQWLKKQLKDKKKPQIKLSMTIVLPSLTQL